MDAIEEVLQVRVSVEPGARGGTFDRKAHLDIGRAFYRPADEQTNLEVLHHAIDIGVNFLDTADMYGVGANERLLAKVLAARRFDVVLATKFGNVRAATGEYLRVDGSPEYVAAACDASLQRLGVDHIDLIPADAIARANAFAIGQPHEVDVNEIVVRPTAQAY